MPHRAPGAWRVGRLLVAVMVVDAGGARAGAKRGRARGHATPTPRGSLYKARGPQIADSILEP
jgi:hypothetical protein